jgi:hypothetical protein
VKVDACLHIHIRWEILYSNVGSDPSDPSDNSDPFDPSGPSDAISSPALQFKINPPMLGSGVCSLYEFLDSPRDNPAGPADLTFIIPANVTTGSATRF